MRSPLSQRAIRTGLSLALVIPFVLHAAGAIHLGFLQSLEQIGYDARVKLTMPGTVDERIVIVEIDEASLQAIGQWPWPRDVLARLVNRLFQDYGIRVLGFDIVFAEPDRSEAAEVLHRLAEGPLADNAAFRRQARKLIPRLNHDRAFARAIAGRDVILGYFFRQHVSDEAATFGMLPRSLGLAAGLDQLPLLTPEGYGANLPILQKAAAGAGFFDNPLVSTDGVFRRVPLIQQYKGELYGMLGLVVARAALGWPPVAIDPVRAPGYHGLEAIYLGSHRIPVDRRGAVLVPFLGPKGSFPYVSAVDVLNGTADPAVLQNRIVLVGATAAGLYDLRTTPVQNVYPGVEIHANIISGILDGRFKHRPQFVMGLMFVVLTGLGIFMTATLPRLSPLWLTTVTAALAGLVVAGNLAAWSVRDLVLPLANPLLLIAVLFVFHVAWGFFVQTRGKRQLARLFGQYVPPELVDEMDRAPEQITLAGESRDMTVLFSDVRGFTSISENLAPSELTQLMNAFLTPMTRAIHRHRGTIDKYMGDAVMAFWGAPLTDPDHARHALMAARDMLTEIAELGPVFERQGWPPLTVGIGINTGAMNVGNMGSEFRMAYTALGDAVNLGSRIEGLTRRYGVPVLVSESTRAAISGIVWREIDVVRVKGKDHPAAIYEPVGTEDEVEPATRDALARYHTALARYRERAWDEAENAMASLLNADPGRVLYALYVERIRYFRQHPPPGNWDGVFTHAEK